MEQKADREKETIDELRNRNPTKVPTTLSVISGTSRSQFYLPAGVIPYVGFSLVLSTFLTVIKRLQLFNCWTLKEAAMFSPNTNKYKNSTTHTYWIGSTTDNVLQKSGRTDLPCPAIYFVVNKIKSNQNMLDCWSDFRKSKVCSTTGHA